MPCPIQLSLFTHFHSSFAYEAGKSSGLGPGNPMERKLSSLALAGTPAMTPSMVERGASLTSSSHSLGSSQNRRLAPQALYSATPNFPAASMPLLRQIPSSTLVLIVLSMIAGMFYRSALYTMWLVSRALGCGQCNWETAFFTLFNLNLNRYWLVATILDSRDLECPFLPVHLACTFLLLQILKLLENY